MWSKVHDNSEVVLHSLPDAAAMKALIHDLPLRAADDGSGPDGMYLRVLQASPSRTSCTLRTCTSWSHGTDWD